MASSAVSNAGKPVMMMVTAFGCTRRIALTTVKPSPGSPMLRSESSTWNSFLLMRSSASGTELAVVTSKPCMPRMAGRVARMPGSSSTNKTRVVGMSPPDSVRYETLPVDGYLDDLFLDGVGHELRLVMDIQLAHQVELMCLDGLHAEPEEHR